jgi:hypothetical protein
MPNTRQFLSAASFSPDTAEDICPQTYSNYCHSLRQPIRTVVSQHILNRQRQPGSYCLSLTTRALATSNLTSKNNTLSWIYVIMPVRSNSSSRHALSVIYPGVRSVVDAIPQVGLNAYLGNAGNIGPVHCTTGNFQNHVTPTSYMYLGSSGNRTT